MKKKVFYPLAMLSLFLITNVLFVSCSGVGDSAKSSPVRIEFLKQLGKSYSPQSSGLDYCFETAMDADENIYCAGMTEGSLGEPNGGDGDVFLAKFNSLGEVQWITQLGATTSGAASAGKDRCDNVAVDSSGNVYCSGYTEGSLGGTNSGFKDALVVKINSNGVVQWVKQYGSDSDDICSDLAVDSNSNVYCAGGTTGAFAETKGGSNDIFVMKLDSSGNLVWKTQLGEVSMGFNSRYYDSCQGIALDDSGNIYCTGRTSSNLGESHAGAADTVVLKLNNAGEIQWISQLGEETMGIHSDGTNVAKSEDLGRDITISSDGFIYTVGHTTSSLAQTHAGGTYDIFITKRNSSGDLIWVKQLGYESLGRRASGRDSASAITTDAQGNIYIAADTEGSFADTNEFGEYGFADALIIKTNSNGSYLWSKQLGEKSVGLERSLAHDRCTGLVVNETNDIYCTGYTKGPLGEENGGDEDVFIMKLNQL